MQAIGESSFGSMAVVTWGQAPRGSKEEGWPWQEDVSMYGLWQEAQVQRVLQMEKSLGLD